ncbi:MAG TPA: hypothetical protein VFN65_08380 [Solirubrobacteraceae bacterium]|nr:hypothetical protein [Solirubrobacteraceae bacterium]
MAEAAVSEAHLARTPPDTRARAEPCGERVARGTLRRQIAHLEAELSRLVVRSFEMRGSAREARPVSAPTGGEARLLDLGELERVRDDLVRRLREAEAAVEELAGRQAAARALLEQMQLDPGRHRFTRIPLRELGEPGCGVWQVRPRLGLIGMLAGWWQITLSSGCPLRGGRADARAAAHRDGGRRAPVDHDPRLDRVVGRHAAPVAVGRLSGPGGERLAR